MQSHVTETDSGVLCSNPRLLQHDIETRKNWEYSYFPIATKRTKYFGGFSLKDNSNTISIHSVLKMPTLGRNFILGFFKKRTVCL